MAIFNPHQMSFNHLLTLYTCSILAIGSTQPHSEISPKKLIVYPDQTGIFRCISTDGYTDWEVNGVSFNSLPSDVRYDMNKDQDNKMLKIFHPSKYNHSNVTCITRVSFESPDSSESTGVLLVQGVLPGVTQLMCNNDSTSGITFSWKAPFSMNMTDDDGDPDIWYSVSIFNISDDTDPTVIPCTDCINITDTQYTFIPDYFNSSHQYNITVTPYNKAGQGESQNIVCPNNNMTVNITSTSPTQTEVFSETPTSHDEKGERKTSRIREYIGIGAATLFLVLLAVVLVVILIVVLWYKKDKGSRINNMSVTSEPLPMNDSMRGGDGNVTDSASQHPVVHVGKGVNYSKLRFKTDVRNRTSTRFQ